MSELSVCVDLMAKGYEVFRAESPHCSCDLVVLDGGRPIRIEVKSGYRRKDGEIGVPTSSLDPTKYDVLAVVTDEVTYTPDLTSLLSHQ